MGILRTEGPAPPATRLPISRRGWYTWLGTPLVRHHHNLSPMKSLTQLNLRCFPHTLLLLADKIVPEESHHPAEHQDDRYQPPYQAPLAGAVPAGAALHLLEVLSQYPSDERPLPPPSITKTLFVLWPRSLPPSAADPDSSEGLAHVERLTAALRRLVERFYTTTRQRMWVLQILMQGVAMDVELEEVFFSSLSFFSPVFFPLCVCVLVLVLCMLACWPVRL